VHFREGTHKKERDYNEYMLAQFTGFSREKRVEKGGWEGVT